jgi:hypothetical protein
MLRFGRQWGCCDLSVRGLCLFSIHFARIQSRQGFNELNLARLFEGGDAI